MPQLPRIPMVGRLLGSNEFKSRNTIRIQAPPKAVWKAILAVDEYPQWQRAILNTKVLDRDASSRPLVAQFELNAMVRTVTYTLVYTYDEPPFKVSWDNDKGSDVKRIHGECEIAVVEGNDDECDLTMTLEVLPGVPIPKHVRTALETSALDHGMEDLERHAQNIAANL